MSERTARATMSVGLHWLGVGLAASYWLVESLIHTLLFKRGSLADNLLARHDANELWMRLTVVVLMAGFGALAERSLRAERLLRQGARQLDSLGRFVERVRQAFQSAAGDPAASDFLDRRRREPQAGATAGERRDRRIEDLAAREDEIGQLSRMLRELAAMLEQRFRELYALLQLTHEINEGLLLDQVLEKSYEHLRAVIPYDRLGLALVDEGGLTASARWVRSDAPVLLGSGYSATLRTSSLQRIIESREPRIINDLVAHLREHPGSESTRLMLAEGIRSSLTCPLVSMGRPVGFVFFSSRSAGTYRSAHVEVFKAIAGHFAVVVDKSNVYQQVLHEKERSERLLLNVVPARVAERLRAGEQTIAEDLPDVAVLFADIVDFTGAAGRLDPEAVLGLLAQVFGLCDRLCDRHGLEKIKTIGDEYMAIGRPIAGSRDGAGARAGAGLREVALFALELLRSVEDLRYPDGCPLRVRVGIHVGPAVAGVIGQKKFAYDIWGNTVNLASRMESTGEAGRIQVSAQVRDRLAGEFELACRGPVELKGFGPLTTYFLLAEKRLA